jgi:V/A-type H+-transporting ATPase subunit I
MARVRVVVLSQFRGQVVHRLHDLGVTQLISSIDEYKGTEMSELIEGDSPGAILRECVDISLRIGHVLEVFSTVEERVTGSPPKPQEVSYTTPGELIKATHPKLAEVEAALNEAEDRLNKLKAEEERLSRTLELAETLKPLGVDFDLLRNGSYTYTTAGRIPSQNVSAIRYPLLEATDRQAVWKEVAAEKESLLLVVTLRKHRDKAFSVLRQYGYTQVDVPEVGGSPDKVINDTKSSMEKLRVDSKELYRTIRNLSKTHRQDLLVLRELVELEREREDARRFLVRTKNTVMFEGWVPERDLIKLARALDEATRGVYLLSKLESHGNPMDPPTLLENPEPIRSFEMLTEMYGSPNYREADPTPFLMASLVIFYGICYADAGYALLLLIASVVMLTKFRMSEDYRRLGVVTLLLSASSFLVGWLSGSFFGDLIGIRPYVVEPLKDPIAWLVGSLEIGIAHLAVGYAIGAWVYFRRRDFISAVCGQISQLLFMTGGIVFTLSFFKLAPVSDSIVLVAKIFMVTGTVLLFFRGGVPRDLGTTARGIPTWILSFYGMVSGILGNVFSYSRLMALSLSGAGLATVMNLMAKMLLGAPVVGPVLFAVLLGFGHLYNASISSVGSFVHSLRLNFYEFFGTFYSGDGSRFAPFKARRNLTKLTEVKQ